MNISNLFEEDNTLLLQRKVGNEIRRKRRECMEGLEEKEENDRKRVGCLFLLNKDELLNNVKNIIRYEFGFHGIIIYFEIHGKEFILKNVRSREIYLLEVNVNLKINYVIEKYNLQNLVYTFGYFSTNNKCEEKFEVEDNTYNIVEEFVRGDTLRQIENLNVFSSISYLFQILFTLSILYTEFGFIHGDVHGGNVIVKKTEQKEITYAYNEKQYKVSSAFGVAVLIDYGNAIIDTMYSDRRKNCISDILYLIFSLVPETKEDKKIYLDLVENIILEQDISSLEVDPRVYTYENIGRGYDFYLNRAINSKIFENFVSEN